MGAKIGLTIVGAAVGAILGGIAGLGVGLAFTQLSGTPSFEGYSGFVVVYWILAGIPIGAIAGATLVIAKVR